MEEPELENAERQQALRKWLPFLWIPPVAMVLLLAGLAYCAR